MKIKLTALILFSAVVISGCGKNNNQTTEKPSEKQTDNKQTENKQTQTSTLQISASDKAVDIQCAGMTCTSCENSVKTKVKKVEGVKDVIADYKSNTVQASYDPTKTNPDKIKEAITAAGYEVKSLK
jgi:copper chaperone